MIVRVIYLLIILIDMMINGQIKFNPSIPFFVMKPQTIINQTLHSYCKEQLQFDIQTMFLNLTKWPSGWIYSYNPYEKFNDDIGYEECTMELRTSIDSQIRLVFYPIDGNIAEYYTEDSSVSIPEFPCLRIRDNEKIFIYDCLRQSFEFDQIHSNEYLSNSNVIDLELILPSTYINDDIRFQILFTSLTRKSPLGKCHDRSYIDCNDIYCVHESARCNHW